MRLIIALFLLVKHQGQRHVFVNVEIGNKVVKLIDKRKVLSSHASDFFVRRIAKILSQKSDASLTRLVNAGKDIKKRGFSASRFAYDCNKLALVKREIDAFQYGRFNLARDKSLFDVSGFQHTVCHTASVAANRFSSPHAHKYTLDYTTAYLIKQ